MLQLRSHVKEECFVGLDDLGRAAQQSGRRVIMVQLMRPVDSRHGLRLRGRHSLAGRGLRASFQHSESVNAAAVQEWICITDGDCSGHSAGSPGFSTSGTPKNSSWNLPAACKSVVGTRLKLPFRTSRFRFRRPVRQLSDTGDGRFVSCSMAGAEAAQDTCDPGTAGLAIRRDTRCRARAAA